MEKFCEGDQIKFVDYYREVSGLTSDRLREALEVKDFQQRK